MTEMEIAEDTGDGVVEEPEEKEAPPPPPPSVPGTQEPTIEDLIGVEVYAPDDSVVVGTWHGQPNYKCAHCDLFATVDGAELVKAHVMTAHPEKIGA